MFATFAVIPADVPVAFQKGEGQGEGDIDHAKVIRYRSSPAMMRVSCRVCGASLGNVEYRRTGGTDAVEQKQKQQEDENENENEKWEVSEWEAATGSLEISSSGGLGLGHGGSTEGGGEGDTAKPDLTGKLDRVQLWVEDVHGDGGAVGWVNAGKLSGMDRFRRGRDSEVVTDEEVKAMLGGGSAMSGNKSTSMDHTANMTLKVQCHCGNVDLDIARPEPDYNQGTGKLAAFFDVCTSCRIVMGFEILSWVTVPRRLITAPNTDLQSYLSDTSKLTHYKTSETVDRYFCTKCAASVFYYKHGLDDLDLSLGLLQPDNSQEVRLLDWLEWQKYPQVLSYTEDAVDGKLVTEFAQGLKAERGESTVSKT